MHNRRRPISILAATMLATAGLAAGAQQRMPPLPRDALTEQQARALADFVAAGGEPTGPWSAFLRATKLMAHARGLADHFTFESVLPGWLREFVILLTAREWTQNYEWNSHYALAID